MKKILVSLLFSVLFAATVIAENITTTDGTVYKDIKVTEITPIGINFISEDRACWVDFRDLMPDLAKKYGYDPAKAAEFEKSLAQNQTGIVADDPAAVMPDEAIPVSDAPPAPAAQPAAAGYSGVTATLPAVNVTVNVPPAPEPQVIVINNGDTVIYDDQDSYQPNTVVWVSWGGRYYPRYYWNYWYWKDRYICWNGRYYPAHCFYRGGVWSQGRYYHYAPDRNHNFPERDRRPRQSYSDRNSKRGREQNQADGNSNRATVASQNDNRNRNRPTVNSDNRGVNKNDNREVKVQPAIVDNSGTGKVQPVVNDNRGGGKSRNDKNDKNDNRNSGRRQNEQADGRAVNQAQPIARANQVNGKTPGTGDRTGQNTVQDTPASQVQPAAVTRPVQAVVQDTRGTSQTQPVIMRDQGAAGKNQGNSSRTGQNVIQDTRGTIRGQVPVNSVASPSTVIPGSDNTDIQSSGGNDRGRDRRGGR